MSLSKRNGKGLSHSTTVRLSSVAWIREPLLTLLKGWAAKTQKPSRISLFSRMLPTGRPCQNRS
jgi:hypothetical protein